MRRVVLDANCFRGAQEHELVALQRRGFRLSVSIEGLRETWAHSVRKDKRGVLETRVRFVLPYLDEETPVAFCGNGLLTQIAVCPCDVLADGVAFRDLIENAWQTMREAGVSDAQWRQVGGALDEEIQRDKVMWSNFIDRAVEIKEVADRKKLEFPNLEYSDERAMAVFRRTLAPPGEMSPNAQERFDGQLRYTASKAQYARNRRPQLNDWIDGRHLQHLAWPAFLATSDVNLIEDVDRSETAQRPWVRTMVELACDELPRGEPWGASAQDEANKFVRAPRQDILRRCAEWRRDAS